MRVFLFALTCVLVASAVQAQTPPTIPVLGVGKVAFDVGLSPDAAQAQGYRAYVDANAPITVTVTCAASANPAIATCTFPLSALNLTATHSLALTAVVTAADGELESAKAPVPFVLRLVGPPVAPTAASSKVQPGP